MLRKKIKFILFVLFFQLYFFYLMECRAYATQTKIVKIVFVGESGSGKTAFICALTGQDFDYEKSKKTLRTSMLEHNIIYDNDTILSCELWDTSGQESVKDQILEYRIKDSHFVVITADLMLSRGDVYEDVFKKVIMEWVQPIKVQYPDIHIILLGTKSDAIDSFEEIKRNFKTWTDCFYGRVTPCIVSTIGDKKNVNMFFNVVKDVIRKKNMLETLPDKVFTIRECINEVDDFTVVKKGRCILI